MRHFLCHSALVMGLFHSNMSFAAVPQQIVPLINELGSPKFVMSSSGSAQSSSNPYQGAWGSTDAYQNLLSQKYGADAVAAAKAEGINPDTLAAFGQIESGFRNVGNSNSSAQGVWQITDGTWNQYASQLGLSSADRNDPTAQAKVASAIISEYSNTVSNATGSPATGAQTYAAYMFGPSAGANIAKETDPNAPLSTYVSSKALAANQMSGWTVGQYMNTVSHRMGSGANETVKSG